MVHRFTALDWNQNQDASAVWSPDFEDKYVGKRNKSDESYEYLS